MSHATDLRDNRLLATLSQAELLSQRTCRRASSSLGRERGELYYQARMAGITSLPNSSMERMVASWDIRDSWP
jgi:hypothetical protein